MSESIFTESSQKGCFKVEIRSPALTVPYLKHFLLFLDLNIG